MGWNTLVRHQHQQLRAACINIRRYQHHHQQQQQHQTLISVRWKNRRKKEISQTKLKSFPPHNIQTNLFSTAAPTTKISNTENAKVISQSISQKGYAISENQILSRDQCIAVRNRMPLIFRGEFDTGVYPDEWHWREGISLPYATREICNAWKSDSTVASVVLDESMGKLVSRITGWESVRVAQDDLVWKVPHDGHHNDEGGIDTVVGFHQDSAYISKQFSPYENNSITVWFALDDADEENGCLEYAVGSHEWKPLLHLKNHVGWEHHGDESDGSFSSFHSSNSQTYRDGLLSAAVAAGVCDSTMEDSITFPAALIETAPVKEGHAIFHHQDTWHGSGPNRSRTRHRRALVVHYLRGDVFFREDHGDCKESSPACPPSSFLPWGGVSYIYGRYKRFGSRQVDENFFPVVYAKEGSEYGLKRTAWLDGFIRKQ